jgi:diguanylate cyclase (GGDEF)-like protein
MKKYFTKSISHDLFFRMVGFGIGMGIIFPFFTYFLLDLPTHKVFSPLFFSLCIAAGIAVGLCNYYLFKMVVDHYLKRIQSKLTAFRKNLENIFWEDGTDFDPEKYYLEVDSADTIGAITEEYNIFMTTFYRILKAERDTANFLERLQQKVKMKAMAETIVEVFKEYFGADGGCLYSLESGRLRQINNCHLMVDSEALDQDYCYEIIKRGEMVVFEDIDNLPVRFNIGIGSLKPNAIAYMPLIYQSRPVGLCILSANKEFKANFFSLESRNLINQAAPFLHNSILMKKLEVLAAVDELTCLLNRRYGMKRLNEEYERAKRHQLPLAVAMLDIDNFKQLNDTYGHQAGDEILKEFSGLIGEEIRITEFALRYGGEEFMIVIPGASAINCHRVIERLRRKVESLHVQFQQHKLNFTFSAGIAVYPGENIADQTQLINATDIALYQAKNRGKNQIVIYSSASLPTTLKSQSTTQ